MSYLKIIIRNDMRHKTYINEMCDKIILNARTCYKIIRWGL